LWGLARLRRVEPTVRRAAFLRWLLLTVATGALIAAVVFPPLQAHPLSLAAKGGINVPDAQTLVGVWYAWFGTPSTGVVVACIAFADPTATLTFSIQSSAISRNPIEGTASNAVDRAAGSTARRSLRPIRSNRAITRKPSKTKEIRWQTS